MRYMDAVNGNVFFGLDEMEEPMISKFDAGSKCYVYIGRTRGGVPAVMITDTRIVKNTNKSGMYIDLDRKCIGSGPLEKVWPLFIAHWRMV